MATVTKTFLAIAVNFAMRDEQTVTKLVSLTFDDAVPITIAEVRAEAARMVSFKDEDTTTTGDTWDGSTLEAAEIARLNLVALFEIPSTGFGLYPPYNIVQTPLSQPYVYGDHDFADKATVFTIDGDNALSGNVTTVDTTPAVLATLPAAGDKLNIYEAGVRLDQFIAGADGAVSGNMAALSVAAHTVHCTVELGDGTLVTLPRSLTITVS